MSGLKRGNSKVVYDSFITCALMGENRNFHFRKGWIPLFIPKLTTSVVEIDFIFTYLVECVDKMEDAFYGGCFLL